jgi:predicted nuclease of predicted toxin-antitoxin system
MANLYADEQFPLPVVELLRSFGHDVLTVQEAGNAGLPDSDVLKFATQNQRVVLTQNRRDFFKLDKQNPTHEGIIACTDDKNLYRLATRINDAICTVDDFKGKVIRVNRPAQ